MAEEMAQTQQTEYERVYRESQKLQEQVKANQRRINALREKDGTHKNTLKTYEALLSTNQGNYKDTSDIKVGGANANKCTYCLKAFQTSEFLRSHYKKRHPDFYQRDGLENQENFQLMANLMQAADRVGHRQSQLKQGSEALEQDELVMKLREQVVDKFS